MVDGVKLELDITSAEEFVSNCVEEMFVSLNCVECSTSVGAAESKPIRMLTLIPNTYMAIGY